MQKVALITGTSSGIGKALAELLLSKSYLVFGYSRTNQIEDKNFTFTSIDLHPPEVNSISSKLHLKLLIDLSTLLLEIYIPMFIFLIFFSFNNFY